MAGRHLTDQQRRRIRAGQASKSSQAQVANSATDIGLVISRFGKQALVETDQGERAHCSIRANMAAIVAGDRVAWCRSETGGVIEAVLDRQSLLSRPDPRGRVRPIAANVDLMAIVFAPEPQPHANLLDRYLVAAASASLEVLLVLNKGDLLSAHPTVVNLVDTYQKLGYPLVVTDRDQDPRAHALTPFIRNKTMVLVGQSGVGKSSLIKRMIPDLEIRIGELSQAAAKGRHTTTAAQLYHFSEDTRLIDSPGIRDFQLPPLPAATVAQAFLEFEPFLGRCSFRDCSHTHETGCALKQAVADDAISPERFASYHAIVGSGD